MQKADHVSPLRHQLTLAIRLIVLGGMQEQIPSIKLTMSRVNNSTGEHMTGYDDVNSAVSAEFVLIARPLRELIISLRISLAETAVRRFHGQSRWNRQPLLAASLSLRTCHDDILMNEALKRAPAVPYDR